MRCRTALLPGTVEATAGGRGAGPSSSGRSRSEPIGTPTDRPVPCDPGKEVSMPNPVLAEIIGPDILIVLAVILVLFGGSQLPKLARGLGSAQREFKKGLEEGAADDKDK